jgi:hypothetical protein
MQHILILIYSTFMAVLGCTMAYFAWTTPVSAWEHLTFNDTTDFSISAMIGLLNISNLYHLVRNKLAFKSAPTA